MSRPAAWSPAAIGAVIGVAIGVALLAALALAAPGRAALAAWLIAWAWCATIAGGALGLDLLLEACHARWQVAVRRPLEALQLILAPLAILFIPIALGARALYPWAARAGAAMPLAGLAPRHPQLSRAGWTCRSCAYLAVLLAIVACLRRASGDRRRRIACAALPCYAIALTGASWDWFMSLDPRFASTVYGAWVWASGVRAAAGLWVVLVVVGAGIDRTAVKNDHLVALGRLLLAFTLIAAYMDFSQLVVAWMADLPAEAAWYQPRLGGTWGALGAAVGIGGYGVPLLALLSQGLKRRALALALVGGWIACWQVADLAWWLAPSMGSGLPAMGWRGLAAVVAVGAACLGCAVLGLRWAPAPEPLEALRASAAYRAEIAA